MTSRFLSIIFAIILVLLINPFVRPLGPGGHLLSTLLIATIPLASVYALTQDRKRAVFILVLAAPFVILDGLSLHYTHRHLLTTTLVFATILYAYIVVLLVSRLLSIRVITADLIYCAISIYLLIGFMWTGLYGVLEGISPGNFAGISDINDLLYFSFVTLTTAGYGDIAPVSILGRRIAIIEAAMGSIYMAVIIAMIVGRYMSLQADHDRQGEAELTK